jgi:hypothetical protein
MPFLLDANAVSELRKPSPNPGVVAWFDAVDPRGLYLSVLTIAEIRRGIELLRPRNGPQARALDDWLTGLSGTHAIRTIGVDLEVADCWAHLNAVQRLPAVDSLLAATALVRGWTIVIRNV